VRKSWFFSFLFCLASSPAQAETCTYQLVDDYTVEYCYYDGCYSTRYQSYGWVCTGGGGGGSDPGGGGDPGTSPPPPPSVSILSVNDGNPNQLLVTVNGSSDVTSVRLYLNGSQVSITGGSIASGLTVAGPSVYAIPHNQTSSITATGCTSDGRCSSDSFDVSRYRTPSGTAGSLTATWADMEQGLPVLRAALYTFSMGEKTINTAYHGVSQMGDGTRIEFSESDTTLSYWMATTPYPIYSASHWVENLGSRWASETNRYFVDMNGCYIGPSMGGGDAHVSACAATWGIGGQPFAGVRVAPYGFFVQTSTGLVQAGIVNNEIGYSP
jgi:hypothetical protein